MKPEIHPQHKLTEVKCTCGNTFSILTRHDNITVDICSACHPFYTGTQKFVDSAGRVDAFTKRFQWTTDEAKKQAKKKTKVAKKKQPKKDLKTELEKKKVFGKKKILPEATEDKGGKKG